MLLLSLTASDRLLSSAQACGLVAQVWFGVLAPAILDGEATKRGMLESCILGFLLLEKNDSASAVFLL